MSKQSGTTSLIPRLDGRALDFIKGLAAVAMVVDHIDHLWFDDEILDMMLVGRTVFPLFCYAVAASLLRDPSQKKHDKYFASLLILALVSEPFIEIARHDADLNVIFTLAFGIFFAGLSRKMKDWQIYACYIVASLAAVWLNTPLEFGLPGILLPSALMLVMEGRNRFLPGLVLLLFTINLGGIQGRMHEMPGMSLTSPSVLEILFMVGLFSSAVPYFLLVLARELPQTGRYLSRYFLHVFYPLHQVVLWALALIFFP